MAQWPYLFQHPGPAMSATTRPGCPDGLRHQEEHKQPVPHSSVSRLSVCSSSKSFSETTWSYSEIVKRRQECGLFVVVVVSRTTLLAAAGSVLRAGTLILSGLSVRSNVSAPVTNVSYKRLIRCELHNRHEIGRPCRDLHVQKLGHANLVISETLFNQSSATRQ